MAQPLTKTKSDGTPYARPPAVEAQIEEVTQLPLSDLLPRLSITTRSTPSYLRHECLVHLVRRGRRSGDQALISAVLPVLLSRCEANLSVTVPDHEMTDAASVRQDILDALADLFVSDGSDNSSHLDFYECRFNMAFRTLRIDTVRQELRRRGRIDVVDWDSQTGEPIAFEDALAKMSLAFKGLHAQDRDARREELMRGLKALPRDERRAVVLVHLLGYKEESQNPNEKTAATCCDCSGRTIRSRLQRAAIKLSRLLEDL